MTFHPKTKRAVTIFAHVFIWSYVFLSPIFFKRSGDAMDWSKYLHGSLLPVTSCIAFYTNFLFLIPRYLLKGRFRTFFAANLCIFLCYQLAAEFQFVLFPDRHFPGNGGVPAGRPPIPNFPPKIFFVIRGFLFYVFVVGISLSLRLSMKWREAELKRTEAELKNLKNQINPHFLLNTLNNIYALTAFDTEQAQQAIQELSRLLRYMLYENQTERVSLRKEVEFIRSYIALMQLRQGKNVEVETRFDFPQEKDIQVAPLIFISLVENAFKHGVSPTRHSFIHITLKTDGDELLFCCENSNFPKTGKDRTPGGIGLKQVRSRLEYTYPKRYTWAFGASDDGAVYTSAVHIKL